RIRPHQTASFLSKQSAYSYRTDQPLGAPVVNLLPGDGGEKQKQKLTGTGLAGVTFKVAAQISSDRRYLRLKVTHDVAQLVRIDKTQKLDPATGKEIEVESPNMSKSSVAGTVQIRDASPILMPVTYRPASQGKDEK